MTKSSVIPITINPRTKNIMVFVSPQYAVDTNISAAVNTYAGAISDETWITTVTNISELDNHVNAIRSLIRFGDPDAVMIIGEDMAMATAQTNGAVPSLVPYYSKDDYETTTDGRVVVKPTVIDTPISLVVPNSDDEYITKVDQICSALTKFSDRSDLRSIYGDRVTCLLGEEIDASKYSDHDSLPMIGDISINIKPVTLRGVTGRKNIVSVIVAESSSNRGIVINSDAFIALTPYVAEQQVDSPILLVGNAYRTIGFSAVEQESSPIYPPVSTEPCFGHCIFDNDDLRVVMNIPLDVLPKEHINMRLLSQGSSIAESVKGQETTLLVIYGDITARI